MSAEEIKDFGFEIYVGLISPTEGLDASGLMTDIENIQNMYHSKYGRKYIPLIFQNNGNVPTSKKEDIESEVVKEVMDYAASTGNDALMGIKMRKQFAGVDGDVLAAPVPKEMVDKIKHGEPMDSAILLAQVATHELVRNKFQKLDSEDRDDIIADLKDAKKRQERSQKTKKKE